MDFTKGFLKTNNELRVIAEKAKVVLGRDYKKTWEFLFDYYEKKRQIYPAICCAEIIKTKSKDTVYHNRYLKLISIYNDKKKQELEEVEKSFSKNSSVVDISVIMPTYNRSHKIKPSIESVLNQTYKNFELIIVNDGGSRDCEDIIHSFKTEKIRYLYVDHKGLSHVLNQGILSARSKYIAYLDDDDQYFPYHLETVVNALEESGYPFVYSDCYKVIYSRKNGSLKEVSRSVPFSIDFNPGLLTERNYIPILCIAHRRECLKKIGLFDIDLPNLMDWDLWIRSSRIYDFLHIKKATCEYHLNFSEKSVSSNRLNHGFYHILLKRHYEFLAKGRWKEIIDRNRKTKISYRKVEKEISRYVYDPYQRILWLLPIAIKDKEWSEGYLLLRKMTRTQPIPKVISASIFIMLKTSLKAVIFSMPVIFFGLAVRFFGHFKRDLNPI